MNEEFLIWIALAAVSYSLATKYQAGTCRQCGRGLSLLQLLRAGMCPDCEQVLRILANVARQN
jgi:DNA-directed RNA polymerase subunit RPC12/RpoP